MTSLNGYIQGLGSGADRIVKKTGKEIKLSVYDNIDRVIVFNEAGETSQKSISGNITWNQLVENESGTSTIGGVTFTKNIDGSYTLSGVPDNNNVFKNINYSANVNKCQLIKDHVYLLPKGTTYSGEIGMGCFGDTSDHYSINGDDIFKVASNSISQSWVRIQISRSLNVDIGTVKIYPQLFDLTKIFGSTTADYIYSLEQATPGAGVAYFRNYFPDDYYAYNTGTVTSLPSPDFPQDIKGIGTKMPDGTYRVFIDYDDGDENYGRITASGLAYPLYEGDILDFVNGKVIRANGYVDLGSLTWSGELISSNPVWYSSIPNPKLPTNSSIFNGKAEKYNPIRYNGVATNINTIAIRDNGVLYVNNNSDTIQPSGNLLYELASTVDEYITLTGDITDIGTATVTADGTLTVKYDKVEMAIRKYSSPPDWSKIGYSGTPSFILDGFNHSKQIYDSWTPAASYASAYRGDIALKFFPEVDITGATNYSAMFQESGLLSTPPLTVGDGSNTVINSQWMFQDSPIEKIELTTSDPDQKVQITNIFSGCSNLKNAKLTLSASGSMASAFADCTQLERIEDGLETSSVTSFSEAFRACSSLNYLYELDLSSCTTCYRAFQNCTSLEHAPYINSINTGGNFQQMFWNCSSLKSLPPYSLGSPSNLTNMFQGTGSNLDENSRNNILMMLAACTYSGTKTLAHLGFTASMYSAASWQALTNYNTFTTAGWSIGYS